MFKRKQHRSVLSLLEAFRADTLARCKFLFGGGTRIVLELGEYRESHDVDFLCSDAEGYAELRFEAATYGFASLFSSSGMSRLAFPREMRIDQYGIRFPVECDGGLVKVELIREARIDLDVGTRPGWSPVYCLPLTDCYAEKLLANSDRWADRQVLSRDLIDLSALRMRCGAIPEPAWRKVDTAYRSASRTDLQKALSAFLEDSRHQEDCFRGLQIEDPGSILEGVERLLREIEV
jgi:hypothetical protein